MTVIADRHNQHISNPRSFSLPGYVGATAFLEDSGQVIPLMTEFDCAGNESNLLECTPGNNATALGSGSAMNSGSDDSLSVNNSCTQMAGVNCQG